LGEIFLKRSLKNKMADIGQIDMGKMTRRYGEEETVRMMKEIMENNEMMLKLQKQIGELQMAEKKENRKRQIDGWKNVGKEMRRKERKERNRRE